MVAALLAAWTALVAASLLQQIPLGLSRLLLLPAGLVGVAALRRAPSGSLLRFAAGWTALVGAACVAALEVSIHPRLATGAPLVLVVAVVANRRPVLVVGLLAVVAGAYGTITAYAGISPRTLVDVLLLGLILAVGWSHVFARRRPDAVVPDLGVVLLGAYCAATFLAVVLSAAPAVAIQSFRTTAWPIALCLVLAMGRFGLETRRRMASVALIVAGVAGAYAAYRFFAGPSAKELALALAPGNPNVIDGRLRTVGSFPTRGELSGFCAALLPFCVAFTLHGTVARRCIAFAASAATGFGVFAGDSRAGALAAAAGILVTLAAFASARAFPGPRLGTTAVAFALVAVLGVGGFSLALGDKPGTTTRYTRFYSTDDVSFVQRRYRYDSLIGDVNRHPLGEGLGHAAPAGSTTGGFNVDVFSVDNSLLKIALEQGLLVMVIFAAGVLCVGGRLVRGLVRSADAEHAIVGVGAIGTLAAFCVLLPLGLYVQTVLVLAVWLVIGLGLAAVRAPALRPA